MTVDSFATSLGFMEFLYKLEYRMKKKEDCVEGHGRGETSKCQRMFVHMRSKPLNR